MAPDGWLVVRDAARALGVTDSTVSSWATRGKLAGSVRADDGRWLVPRAAVDRIVEEREAALERNRTRWQPMTERRRPDAGVRPSCEAITTTGLRCRRWSAGRVEVAGLAVELCAPHRRQAERGDVVVEPIDPGAGGSPPTSRSAGRWRPEDDAYLRDHPDSPARATATALDRTVDAVNKRRSRLRLAGQG